MEFLIILTAVFGFVGGYFSIGFFFGCIAERVTGKKDDTLVNFFVWFWVATPLIAALILTFFIGEWVWRRSRISYLVDFLRELLNGGVK